MIECEVKLKIENSDYIKDKLLSLGFTEYELLTETDTYFDTVDGDIRNNDRALRIRETVNHSDGSKHCTINFKDKKLDNISMSRPEYETEIADSVVFTRILSSLGYIPVEPKVVKARTVLKDSFTTACIDSVEGHGEYLELEVMVSSENQKASGLGQIEGILSDLGYRLSDTTTTSYLSALQKSQHL